MTDEPTFTRPLLPVERGRSLDMYRRWSRLGLAPRIVEETAEALITVRHTTLKEWLDSHPGEEHRPTGRALRARVVELHASGYCHRDLHRDNVVVRDDDVPLFIDPAFAIENDPARPSDHQTGCRCLHADGDSWRGRFARLRHDGRRAYPGPALFDLNGPPPLAADLFAARPIYQASRDRNADDPTSEVACRSFGHPGSRDRSAACGASSPSSRSRLRLPAER